MGEAHTLMFAMLITLYQECASTAFIVKIVCSIDILLLILQTVKKKSKPFLLIDILCICSPASELEISELAKRCLIKDKNRMGKYQTVGSTSHWCRQTGENKVVRRLFISTAN